MSVFRNKIKVKIPPDFPSLICEIPSILSLQTVRSSPFVSQAIILPSPTALVIGAPFSAKSRMAYCCDNLSVVFDNAYCFIYLLLFFVCRLRFYRGYSTAIFSRGLVSSVALRRLPNQIISMAYCAQSVICFSVSILRRVRCRLRGSYSAVYTFSK